MPLVGDFQALGKLRAKIQEISKAGFRDELAQAFRGTITKLVADEFRASIDPYGAAWAPLRYRSGKPLVDTGRMKASVNVTADQAGVRVTITVEYSRYHQAGTRTLPRRLMLPERDMGGLGAIWEKALLAEAMRFMKRKLGPKTRNLTIPGGMGA